MPIQGSNITLGSINSMLPFLDGLEIKNLTGSQLLSTFQWGVQGVGICDAYARFPQVAGG